MSLRQSKRRRRFHISVTIPVIGCIVLIMASLPIACLLAGGISHSWPAVASSVGNSADLTLLVRGDAVVLPAVTGQTPITVQVRDQRGRPVSSTQVQFSSTLGSMTPGTVTTDSYGVARSRFHADNTSGQVRIVVTANGVFQQMYLQVSDPARVVDQARLTLTVDATSLTPGQKVNVLATLRDASGKPHTGEIITLFGSLGELSDVSGITDSNGQIAVTFAAGAKGGDARITALAGMISTSVPLTIGQHFGPVFKHTYLPLIARR